MRVFPFSLFGAGFLLLLGNPVLAETRTWPGAAPCSTTLQACIDASASGDIVLIASDTAINEDITLSQSLSLLAAPGRIARFAAGRGVSGTFNSSPLTLHIEGLHLSGGAITVQHNAPSPIDVRILRNRLDHDDAGDSGIVLVKSNANGNAVVDVSENQVQGGFDGATDAAIRVGLNADASGKIAFNRVRTDAAVPGSGIQLHLSPGDAHTLAVYANRVEGSFESGSIRMATGVSPFFGSAGSATAVLRAFSNVIDCRRQPGNFPLGLWFASFSPTDNELRLFNNTVVGCADPLTVAYPTGGASVGGSIFNNLIAYNQYSLSVSANVVADFVIERNLSHGNSFNDMPASATGTVTDDPLLFSMSAPRPTAGSPAIDAGNAISAQLLYAVAGAPQVDADGRRRTVGAGASAIDIGAYEFGDRVSLARNTGAAGTAVALGEDDELLPLQISKSFNPLPAVEGVANPNPVAAFHLLRWFARTLSGQMPAGAGFHVMAPGPAGAFSSQFLHLTNGTNTLDQVTALSSSHLNSRRFDQAIVLATPVWRGGDLNARNIIVNYSCAPATTGAGCWTVSNQNAAPMPLDYGFHIHSQDRSPNAFVHRVAQTEQFSPFVGHPVLGNDPQRCARPLASPRGPQANDTTFELEYRPTEEGGTWGIWGDTPMPAGAEFFVYVDQAAFEACTASDLFKDGFES